MSYCRTTTNCCQSDVYVYEHTGGWWQISVARGMPESETPRPEPQKDDSREEFVRYHTECSEWRDTAHYVPIGLPHDGASYECKSPGECADVLEELAAEGYRVPDGVIETLREEQSEIGKE